MKSLNTPPHIEKRLELITEFKRFNNIKQGTKLDLYSSDLNGYDCAFKLWLNFEKGITRL